MNMMDRYKDLERELENLKRVEREHDYAAGYQISISTCGHKDNASASITLTEGLEQFVDLIRNQMLLERDIAVVSLKDDKKRLDEFLKGLEK